MILSRSRRFLPLALILAGATLFYAIGAAFLAHAAHAAADPSVAVSGAVDTGWDVFTKDGPLWAVLLLAAGLLRTFLNRQHWLAQGKVLSGITGCSMVLAAVLAWHFAGAPASGILTALLAGYTLITHSTVPGAVPKSATPSSSTVAILAVLLLGMGASQLACSASAKAREAAAVGAFMGCEAPHVDATMLADATVLAEAAALAAIDGSGHPDGARLKADAAPLKSDLLRCAWDAAIAALATPAPKPQAGAPAAAAFQIDSTALRARWAQARAELGWAPRKGGV